MGKELERDTKNCKRRSRCFFLDSGAHSLYTEHVMSVQHKNGYSWYESDEFWKYCDEYATFVKEHIHGIDYYANVDVIFNPELTWKAQKYLENVHNLCPVPVVHYGTDLRWLDTYLRDGHKYIGIGGLGQEATAKDYLKWADKVFARLCSGAESLPCVRTHGFAMTSFSLMRRYPWWSVDSASWAKNAGFGSIYVPHKRNGKFTFETDPYTIGFSIGSDSQKKKNAHFLTLNPSQKKIVEEWLEEIQVRLGVEEETEDIQKQGVLNHYGTRATANLRFFERLCSSFPPYPRPFKLKPRKGFFQ